MVEIYSPSGREEKLVDFLQPEMEENGFEVRRDSAGNLIGRIGRGEKKITLMGHLDTVAGEIDVREEGGKLYGRGSVDAKSPLANFIGAASQFSDSENLEITVIGAVEEETSSRGAYEVTRDFSADYVVIGEPSGWNGITLGYRGSFCLNYELELPKTHRGEGSALPGEKAVSFYQELKELFPSDSSGFYDTDVRLTKLNTDEGPFADSVEMRLDIRTGPDYEPEDLEGFLASHGGTAKIDKTREIPPVRSSKRNKLVSAFLSGIREAGGQPKFKLKTGTADMNIVAQNWEGPIIAYGPGDSSLDHTPNEHLDLEEFERAGEVLESALGTLEDVSGD